MLPASFRGSPQRVEDARERAHGAAPCPGHEGSNHSVTTILPRCLLASSGEGRADLVEFVDLVDRQLQLARFHRAPDVLADFFENLTDLLDGAGAEVDADTARILDWKL